ncbi:major facilitator superfamily domain-containing protein [Geopyxis carbonaria]|nr:major facilitator superfamily domain-containing protein [Geopyxis carbonaria]
MSMATPQGLAQLPVAEEHQAMPVKSRDQNDVGSTDVGDENNEETDLERAETNVPAYSTFSPSQKRWIVLMVGCASFFSPLSANIYFPALGVLSRDLKVSTELINLTITSYMIFQGIAPTIFGELADMRGRRPVYIITFVIYLGANLGLALQRNYVALLILRMLQSTGSSGVIALASGVVADIAHSGERGVYMGLSNLGAMCGPAVGPVLGGILSEELGWWWIFWLLVIMSGTFLVFLIIFFPETGRKVVGNGSIAPSGINVNVVQLLRRQNKTREDSEQPRAPKPELRFPNPLHSVRLIMEKDMGLVLFINSIFYTAFYTIMASLPSLFKDIFRLNELQIGLCYLPFGVGCALASVISGRIIDRDYRITAKERGIEMDRKRGEDMLKFPIEEARLRSIFGLLAVYVASIIAYGWVLEKSPNLGAALFIQFVAGIMGTSVFNMLSTFIVDLYPTKPSSATACNNLVRCLMGAGGTAAIESMLKAMGKGWCFTFVGLLCASMTPLLLVEKKYGMGWRLARAERERKRSESEAIDTECTKKELK